MELYNLDRSDNSCPVHVCGVVELVDGNTIDIPNVLLDTGAITANYMSTVFYNKYFNLLEPVSTLC